MKDKDVVTGQTEHQQEHSIASAQWLSSNEAAQKYSYKDGAFWLGRNPLKGEQAIGVDDDRHVLLVAAPRSGKGRCVIVNNLVSWQGSVISIDPKGENAILTAKARGLGSDYSDGMGQDVYVLDPFKTTESHIESSIRAFYNPLDDMDINDPELPKYAARIADSMVILSKNSAEWDKKGGDMIATLILHVKTSLAFTPEQRNLVTVRKLILSGDWQAFEELKAVGYSPLPSPFGLLWQGVIDNPACDGMISDKGRGFLHSLHYASKYYDSIRTSAEDHTNWLDSAGIREVISGSHAMKRTFQMDDLKNHPKGLSVYLCLPQADMATYSRWQRMMVDLMLAAMQKSQKKPVCGHRVLFSLDEFAGLGKMERIRTAAAEVAGAGVKLFLSVQGLNQLKEIYEEGWEIFVGSSGVQIYFGMNDNFTRDYIQKALGETEIMRTTYTQSHSANKQQTYGTSEGQSSGTSDTTTEGENSGWSRGKSGGKSKNSGKNGGSASGKGYGPHIFFEGFEKTSNYDKNEGWQKGKASHKDWQTGTSGGTHSSNANTTSQQYQYSAQEAKTVGETQGFGSNQTIHKKPLVTFDEANKLFARIDDPNHPAYPGLALVRIAGEDPVLVRLAHYDQDPQFVKKFDPHPDHEFIPYVPPKPLSEPERKGGTHLKNRTVSRVGIEHLGLSEAETKEFKLLKQRFHDNLSDIHEVTRILPFDLETVWHVLTESQYWLYWLTRRGNASYSDYGYNTHVLENLSDNFNCEHLLKYVYSSLDAHKYERDIFWYYSCENLQKNNWVVCVLDAEYKKSLSIQFIESEYIEPSPITIESSNTNNMVYAIEITSMGHAQCAINIKRKYISCWSKKIFIENTLAVFSSFFKGLIRAVFYDHYKEYKEREEHFLSVTAHRFENLCYDLCHYQKPIHEDSEKLQWFTWDYIGGELYLYPNRDGNPCIEEGMVFHGTDKLGYIYNKKYHASQEEAEKRHYIQPVYSGEGKFIIRDVLKNHGDTVEMGDRLFLYEGLEDG